MELGKGFTFEKRQYRISISGKHFYVDLVFYHRILKCFILIDLKRGEVTHQDVGQMNLYLNYFRKEVNTDGDNQPIGIVLGAEKDHILVEYATDNITNQLFVSKYQLYLPDKKQLQNELEKLLEGWFRRTITQTYFPAQNQRAEYGKEIISTLSIQLTEEYGKGWSKRQLHHSLRFAETFPDITIVHTLCTQLSWSHIRLIIPMETDLQRQFYIEICRLEKWSVRTFQECINSMLYERTAISKKPELTIQNELELLINNQHISPHLVFKDPYFLDFLGLKDTYSEKDL